MKPIKTQEEAEQVREYLIKMTMDTLNLTRSQAEQRIDALLKSPILINGKWNDPKTQKAIDEFLRNPIEQ